MKKFLLSILCCLLAVSGYAQGSDDFNTLVENSGYQTFTTTNGWACTNASRVSIDNTIAPTINGHTSKKGTITSPTLKGGCGRLSLRYAFPFTEKNGVSFHIAIKQNNNVVQEYDVKNTTATKGQICDWSEDINVEGDFIIYITNNSPTNKASNIDRYSIWNIQWTGFGGESIPTLDAPTFTPEVGEFIGSTEVSILATDGATIYYTLDGTKPTEESNIYEGSFTISTTTTVKAFAKQEGYNDSPESMMTFRKVTTLNNSSVAETIAAYQAGDIIESNATVVGYIVGAIDGKNISDANFEGNWETNTNILLADDADETNVENCIPVQLPNNSLRSELNLVANPDNHKKKVILTGSVEAYFTVAGLKNTSAYTFIEETWGSLYLPIAIDIPEDVKAYIVTGAGSDYVSLTQITGALPANTGIIYNGAWTPNLSAEVVNDEADVTGNLLEGSVAATDITEEAYVLAKVDGEVGFYKAQMNQQDGNAFLNNANKAYLPVKVLPAAVQGANGFKFRFETTGVEGVQVAQGKKVIFDLSGRKVSDMTAPGVYIVNGKKVLVK